jgi:hypothetical protein
MPDILAMLTAERNKLNRAIEALGGEVGNAIIRLTKLDPKHGTRKRRSGPKPGQHFQTAASKAKIAAAQRARWAKVRMQSAVKPAKKKFTMSAEARARIAAGQKARWAKVKGESGKTKAPKKKFVMSAEAKAKISKAMKARWAAKKKGG